MQLYAAIGGGMKQRMERVNELIHREVSEILERDYRDTNFGLLTVTEVRASKDLRYAKVFISAFGKDAHKIDLIRFLKEKTSTIQSEVGRNIQLRYTPALQFRIDETGEKMNHLDHILKELEEKKSHASAPQS